MREYPRIVRRGVMLMRDEKEFDFKYRKEDKELTLKMKRRRYWKAIYGNYWN